MRPFKTYAGGKCGNGTFQTIINEIPKIDVFVEVFCGNCSISSKLKPPAITVVNDIDSYVISQIPVPVSQSFIIENLDWRDLLVKYNSAAGRKLYYFDPPYLFTTRKSNRPIYNYEWSMSDHIKFVSEVSVLKTNCIISHYPCDLYNTALHRWRKVEYKSMTRAGMALEAIWMNYPNPTTLQDYRYIGLNYTDRQRIKRKLARTLANIAKLPQLERSQLLEQLYDIVIRDTVANNVTPSNTCTIEQL